METINEDNNSIAQQSEVFAAFYHLPGNVDVLDITNDILASDHVTQQQKTAISNQKRQLAIFRYPSDNLNLKALISYVPKASKQKTLIILRGGSKSFGIPNPASNILMAENYNVLLALYRGGINGGTDEFGGADVNDVKNLIDYIPQLSELLDIPIQNEGMYMIGSSRGGMQMFLTLARFPDLQYKFRKIVSLSGLLDLHHTIASRADMREMFIHEFGLVGGVNDHVWVNSRNPMHVANALRKDLPVLILQGTEDLHIDLDQGYNMVKRLRSMGNDVTYIEIEGGDHCLTNQDNRTQIITDWLNV